MFRPISWGSMHHNIAVKLLSITSSTIFVIAILACSSTKEVVVQVDKIVEVPVEKIVKVEVDKQVVVEKEVVKVVEVENAVTKQTTILSVVDALGETITFESIPENIATIRPTATEILYAAGGSAILRDSSSTFPVEVQELPDVGGAYNPSIEVLLKSKPDLVIIEALTQARFAPILQQSGLKVIAVKAETVEDITNHIINIGNIIGKSSVSTKKVSEIESRLKEIENSDDRSVLILISDQDQNLYAAGPKSYPGLIVNIVGMENKANNLLESGPYPGFSMVSAEIILSANPDIILTITPVPEPAPRLSETITRIPPFAALISVQKGNIYEADATLFLQAPGPRILEAINSLKHMLESKDD